MPSHPPVVTPPTLPPFQLLISPPFLTEVPLPISLNRKWQQSSHQFAIVDIYYNASEVRGEANHAPR
jgi:hypothetical protein